MTHIESTLPEMVGSEVVGLSLRDADGLAAAALYALVENATGCRLPQTDSTPSSEVEEMLALCSAVLRRHWQTPLTMLDGLSLQDLVSRLMADRVEGNATLGIPAVNGSVTEALSALLERKITGAPEVADGMSLVRLFCDSAVSLDTLTTLTDPTTGWTMDKAMPNTFANLERLTLNCVSINFYGKIAHLPSMKNLSLPYAVIEGNAGQWGDGMFTWDGEKDSVTVSLLGVNILEGTNNVVFFNGMCDTLNFLVPKIYTNWHTYIIWSGSVRVLNMKDTQELGSYRQQGYHNVYFFRDKTTSDSVEKIILGSLIAGRYFYLTDASTNVCDNLIHLEVGEGTCVDLDFSKWGATTALSSNLLQFLSNFREFLFLRLADRTGQTALTLTLSQAVYLAITGTDTTTTALTLTLNQLGITDLTDKETQAGITLNTTYATWLETYRDAINWNIGYV